MGTFVPVPIPPLPAWVSLTWTPTRSGAVLWCDRCNAGTCLYSTVLMRDPQALTRAAEEHSSCAPR